MNQARTLKSFSAFLLMLSFAVTGFAQPGHRHDERFAEDQALFHKLLENREKITREVKLLPDGVETLTESDDPEVVAMLQEHVMWMADRVENKKPIRMRDPLFAEIFRHTEKIKMKKTDTPRGVRVVETSDDPYVAVLIQAHAKVVSAFVEKGFEEAMKNHDVPVMKEKLSIDFQYPEIEQYGGVVPLPDAAQQPRAKSKIVVDLTAGGDPGELYASVDKLARFVNIYGGAGKKSQQVTIAVVMHGDATFAALNNEAYGKKFKGAENANLECLQKLKKSGVELFVCGQSLIRKGGQPEQVVPYVDVAVSGLTSLVNLQQDGYAYFPLFD